MKKTLHKAVYIIPVLIVGWLLWILFCGDSKLEDKMSLVALVGTLFIYSLQWICMRQQRDVSILSAKSQEKIMQQQYAIANKQFFLALLKEKQEIREEYRQFMVFLKDKINNLIYDCEQLSLEELRKYTSKNYSIFMRILDLFGQKLATKAQEAIYKYEEITCWETNKIAELKIFEHGMRHEDREKAVKNLPIEDLIKRHTENQKLSIEAKQIFSEVLKEMHSQIDELTKELCLCVGQDKFVPVCSIKSPDKI